MALYKCGHCGSKTILSSYWNNIPGLHCLMCGTSIEDAIGIFSIKTGERIRLTPPNALRKAYDREAIDEC